MFTLRRKASLPADDGQVIDVITRESPWYREGMLPDQAAGIVQQGGEGIFFIINGPMGYWLIVKTSGQVLRREMELGVTHVCLKGSPARFSNVFKFVAHYMDYQEELKGQLTPDNKTIKTVKSLNKASRKSVKKGKVGKEFKVADVVGLLEAKGLIPYVEAFKKNKVNGVKFFALTDDGLQKLGVGVPEHRTLILNMMEKLLWQIAPEVAQARRDEHETAVSDAIGVVAKTVDGVTKVFDTQTGEEVTDLEAHQTMKRQQLNSVAIDYNEDFYGSAADIKKPPASKPALPATPTPTPTPPAVTRPPATPPQQTGTMQRRPPAPIPGAPQQQTSTVSNGRLNIAGMDPNDTYNTVNTFRGTRRTPSSDSAPPPLAPRRGQPSSPVTPSSSTTDAPPSLPARRPSTASVSSMDSQRAPPPLPGRDMLQPGSTGTLGRAPAQLPGQAQPPLPARNPGSTGSIKRAPAQLPGQMQPGSTGSIKRAPAPLPGQPQPPSTGSIKRAPAQLPGQAQPPLPARNPGSTGSIKRAPAQLPGQMQPGSTGSIRRAPAPLPGQSVAESSSHTEPPLPARNSVSTPTTPRSATSTGNGMPDASLPAESNLPNAPVVAMDADEYASLIPTTASSFEDPSALAAPWYIPIKETNVKDANVLLAGQPVGSFVVSRRGQDSFFLHYVASDHAPKAAPLLVEADSISLPNTGASFKTISELVAHFSAENDTLPHFLRLPGAIPSSEIQYEPWFAGDLPKEKAHQLIQYEKDGSFILRNSNQYPGSFALSFMRDGVIRETLLQRMGGVLTIGASTHAYPSLHQFVNEAMETVLPVVEVALVAPEPLHIILANRLRHNMQMNGATTLVRGMGNLLLNEWDMRGTAREQCLGALSGKGPGGFVVHSSRSSFAVLSFNRADGSQAHMHVEDSAQGVYIVKEKMPFPDLQSLIAAHMQSVYPVFGMKLVA